MKNCVRILVVAIFTLSLVVARSSATEGLQAGVAEVEITPPLGFPMAGYYHERMATGVLDPLKAKAIVLRQGELQVAIVCCDLTGIATDLTVEVRQRAAKETSIPEANIILSATHSHTAPDYTRDLIEFLVKSDASSQAKYAPQLVQGIVKAISLGQQRLQPVTVRAGTAKQETPIAFNRRFVMKDGSVRTWMSLDNPDVIRPAGPIDPQVGIVALDNATSNKRLGVLTNFALHLDTVGGTLWSADYPYFVEQILREKYDPDVISIFGLGCCGDINHVNPASKERNSTETIGRSLAATIESQLGQLESVAQPTLAFRSAKVMLPLREITDEKIERAMRLLPAAQAGEKVDFFDLVEAYKTVILDQMQNTPPHADSEKLVNWGLSRRLTGIGKSLPVEVQTVTMGRDVAIVFLPGEIFVELGLAIKQASPFNTTLVIELSNAVETAYVPTRAAYAVGSYEVTNSTVQAGSGEMLVEAAIGLLREIASTTP